MHGGSKWAITALGMVFAAAVGAFLARPARTPPPAPALAGPGPRLATVEAKLDRLLAGTAAGAGWSATAAEVTRLREELAALRQEIAVPVNQAAPAAEAVSPERAAQAIAARDRVRTLIDGARGARRWGDGDREALREVVGQLTPADRDRMTAELFHAINQQEIALEGDGPPL